MLSIRPKKAELNALNRQELSSGIIRRTIVALRAGRGISGESCSILSAFLDNRRGLLAPGDDRADGVVPTLAREKDGVIVAALVLFRRFGFDSSLAFKEIDDSGLGGSFGLTMSCSRSNLSPVRESG